MILDSKGNAVKTGDIVWRLRKSYIFIDHDDHLAHVLTTDDRRMFCKFPLSDFNLTLEATHEDSSH